MEGGQGNTMDGETKIERAIVLEPLPNSQRPQAACDHAGGGEEPDALRARLIATTVELVAEQSSDPRLIETRHICSTA